jgi:hypothetical protein
MNKPPQAGQFYEHESPVQVNAHKQTETAVRNPSKCNTPETFTPEAEAQQTGSNPHSTPETQCRRRSRNRHTVNQKPETHGKKRKYNKLEQNIDKNGTKLMLGVV